MKRFLCLLLISAIMVSCEQYRHLPTPYEWPQNPMGATVEVQVDGLRKEVHGELIAMDSAMLYILTKGSMVTVEMSRAKKVELHVSRSSENPQIITAWSYLMPLITLSHGWFFILTFPVNAIAGALISEDARNSTYGKIYFRPVPFHEISKFARFPQGIPDGVNILDIK
jgi:hypothetical protein